MKTKRRAYLEKRHKAKPSKYPAPWPERVEKELIQELKAMPDSKFLLTLASSQPSVLAIVVADHAITSRAAALIRSHRKTVNILTTAQDKFLRKIDRTNNA